MLKLMQRKMKIIQNENTNVKTEYKKIWNNLKNEKMIVEI